MGKARRRPLLASVILAMLLTSFAAAVSVAASRKTEAAFPGRPSQFQNGAIAFSGNLDGEQPFEIFITPPIGNANNDGVSAG